MLRVVLPVTVASCRLIGRTISVVDVLPVAVVDEVIVVIYVDVVVASPPGSIAPAAAPERAHRDADAEPDRDTGSVVARGWIVDRRIRINRRAVNDDGVVGRDVDHLRIGLLDDDDLSAFDDLSRDLLLLGGLQVARGRSLLSHALHGVHHVVLLRQEGIAEVGRPLDVVGQALDDVGQSRCAPWLPGELLRLDHVVAVAPGEGGEVPALGAVHPHLAIGVGAHLDIGEVLALHACDLDVGGLGVGACHDPGRQDFAACGCREFRGCGVAAGAAVTVTVGTGEGADGAQPATAKAPSRAAADKAVRLMFIAILSIQCGLCRPLETLQRIPWGKVAAGGPSLVVELTGAGGLQRYPVTTPVRAVQTSRPLRKSDSRPTGTECSSVVG